MLTRRSGRSHRLPQSSQLGARRASARPISTLPVPSTTTEPAAAPGHRRPGGAEVERRDLGRGANSGTIGIARLGADEPGDRAGERRRRSTAGSCAATAIGRSSAAGIAAHPQRREVAGAATATR